MKYAIALVGSIFISIVALVLPAQSGILTLDITGNATATFFGFPVPGGPQPFDLHLVGPDGNNNNTVQLTSATLQVGPLPTFNFPSPTEVGLHIESGNDYAFFRIVGDPDLFRLFFSAPDFLTLQNNNGSFGPLAATAVPSVFAAHHFVVTFSDVEMSGISTAAPELSTWMMMLLGFTGLGFMAYRRQRRILAVA